MSAELVGDNLMNNVIDIRSGDALETVDAFLDRMKESGADAAVVLLYKRGSGTQFPLVPG